MIRVHKAYLEAWRNAVDDLWKAFVLRHALYHPLERVDTIDQADEKIIRLAFSLDDVHVPCPLGRRIKDGWT